ncbi:hypothetical protein BG006_003862 [Podila minutissima]|uniref:Uncharacterized protein n=1 Tax=Podila minutissima TaxID=64525 RepID=A0A9P5VG54_9FUNG|nr:hypothetical protein BG006_003862 [Podila minutissima]
MEVGEEEEIEEEEEDGEEQVDDMGQEDEEEDETLIRRYKGKSFTSYRSPPLSSRSSTVSKRRRSRERSDSPKVPSKTGSERRRSPVGMRNEHPPEKSRTATNCDNVRTIMAERFSEMRKFEDEKWEREKMLEDERWQRQKELDKEKQELEEKREQARQQEDQQKRLHEGRLLRTKFWMSLVEKDKSEDEIARYMSIFDASMGIEASSPTL